MGNDETHAMTSRALMTEREREIVSGEAEVDDEYRWQVTSRVRKRFKENLADDMRAMAEHGDLLEELRYIVCTDFEMEK